MRTSPPRNLVFLTCLISGYNISSALYIIRYDYLASTYISQKLKTAVNKCEDNQMK